MKKFLSLILAAALVISLVPSAFANGETVYTYYFNYVALGQEPAEGTSQVNLEKGMVASSSGNTWECTYRNANNRRLYKEGLSGNTKANTKPVEATGFAFKLTVPQKGTYVPTVVYDMAARGAIISVRLFTETTRNEKGWKIDSTGIPTIIEEFPLKDSEKCNTHDENAAGLKIDKASEPFELPRVDLEAGNGNHMLISPLDWDEEAVGTANVLFEIRSISLTKVPAAKVEIGNDIAMSEGETLELTAKVYDSGNLEISDTVTFESSSPSVVSVDAETGAIVANAVGTAKITATTSNGKTDTINVTVGKGTRFKFTLASLKDDITTESNLVLDKEGVADGVNYEYINDGAARWDALHAYGVQTLRLYQNNFSFRMKRGVPIVPNVNGITFRIEVPESGEYKLRYNYFEDALGLKTGVWFADEKMLAGKDITMAGGDSNLGCRLIMTNFDPDIEVESYNESVGSDDSNPNRETKFATSDKTYNLAKGEYYIVLGITGIGFDNSATGGAAGVTADGAFSFILADSIDLIKTGDYVAPEVPASPAKTDLFVYSPILGAVTSKDIPVGEKLDISVGTEISLKAEETVGVYSFVGWKNGAGILVSTNAEETFDIITKTVIMAVYDKKDASSKVEFWNANGSLIKTVPVDAGAKFGDIEKPSASLNGYGAASGWSIPDDAEINGTVRAVAVYDYEDTGIAVSNVKVNGTAVEDAVYNQKLNLSESGATYWTRNAKTVAFGESFVHYVFNSANGSAIVAHKGAVTVRPVVTLDTNNGDYSMIEYDAAGMKIVEAGIIYGPSKSISLNSYVTKASVKNIKKHGQFIAAPNPDSSLDQSVARGYIVYLDGNEYKVAYSD